MDAKNFSGKYVHRTIKVGVEHNLPQKARKPSEVVWPRAFKSGFVQGQQAIRAYWTEQWSEINPHVEPVSFYREDTGCILVEVHQVVRDLAAAILADEHVGHRFTMKYGLIQRMEVRASPAPNHNA